jgi:hypothetical protein
VSRLNLLRDIKNPIVTLQSKFLTFQGKIWSLFNFSAWQHCILLQTEEQTLWHYLAESEEVTPSVSTSICFVSVEENAQYS